MGDMRRPLQTPAAADLLTTLISGAQTGRVSRSVAVSAPSPTHGQDLHRRRPVVSSHGCVRRFWTSSFSATRGTSTPTDSMAALFDRAPSILWERHPDSGILWSSLGDRSQAMSDPRPGVPVIRRRPRPRRLKGVSRRTGHELIRRPAGHRPPPRPRGPQAAEADQNRSSSWRTSRRGGPSTTRQVSKVHRLASTIMPYWMTDSAEKAGRSLPQGHHWW